MASKMVDETVEVLRRVRRSVDRRIAFRHLDLVGSMRGSGRMGHCTDS